MPLVLFMLTYYKRMSFQFLITWISNMFSFPLFSTYALGKVVFRWFMRDLSLATKHSSETSISLQSDSFKQQNCLSFLDMTGTYPHFYGKFFQK